MRNRLLGFVPIMLLTLSVLSGCGRVTEEPTRVVPVVAISTLTPGDSGAVADPLAEAARDAALAYLRERHPDQAPAADLLWMGEPTTVEGRVGSQAYRYTGGNWVITVDYSAAAPEATTYHVVVVDGTTGFRWEGNVNNEGQVVGVDVNPVKEAGLDRTVEIDLLEIVGGQGVSRAMVTDPQVIAQCIAALDTDLPLGPRAGVPVPYLLEFHLDGGTVQRFDYAPRDGHPALLRGEQGFWQGQDGQPPPAFEALMSEWLVAEPEAVPNPAGARDAVLAYLARTYGGQAPPSGLPWVEENITPEGSTDSSSYRYTAGDWTITVTFSLVAPEATNYRVVVSNPVTGFNWEGQVDAQGNVTELSGPPVTARATPRPSATVGATPEPSATVTQTPQPSATVEGTPQVPTGLANARDAVLAYLAKVYGDQAPPSGLGWSEQYVRPEGTTGPSGYRYTAGDWQVTVTAPLAAPGETVYRAIVTNPATGFYWEGDVDASMRVSAGSKLVISTFRAVIAYLGQRKGLQLPAPGMGWAEGKDISVPGQATSEYRFEDWVITITYSTLDPVELIFEVEVANQAIGYQWKGQVNAAGKVTES